VISTLIVEDDYHVATIHSAYVRRVRGFSVLGHASSAASARTEIRRLAP
jgi:two-component system CitB family response regulator